MREIGSGSMEVVASAHEGRRGQEKIGEGEISEKRNNFSLLTWGDDK